MSDLTKILMSVGIGWLGGLITSILLEPFKSWYVRRFTAQRAKTAIYKELGDLYYTHVSLAEGPVIYHVICLKRFRPDAFHYYYDTQREAFYRMPEWRHLLGIYEFMDNLKARVEKEENAEKIAEDIAATFTFQFQHNLIDEGLVKQYATAIQKHNQTAMRRGQSITPFSTNVS